MIRYRALASAQGLSLDAVVEHKERIKELEQMQENIGGDFEAKLEKARIKMKGNLKDIQSRGLVVKR